MGAPVQHHMSTCFGRWSENKFSVSEQLEDNARKVQFPFQPNPNASWKTPYSPLKTSPRLLLFLDMHK